MAPECLPETAPAPSPAPKTISRLERRNESQKRWRAKHPNYSRDWSRAYRAKNPSVATDYMKLPRGRVCRYCGRTDRDCIFVGKDQCNTCHTRKERNGCCRRCGEPRYRRRTGEHSWGKTYCRSCEESSREARTLYEALSAPQRALCKPSHAGRALLLWEILRAKDGDRISKADSAATEAPDGNQWRRLTRWAVSLPERLAVLEREPTVQGGLARTVLVVRRRQLAAFLEPVVQWFAWQGVGGRKSPWLNRKKTNG